MTKLPDKYILNLPDIGENEKHPETPQYTMLEMAQLCEKHLPEWNAKRFAKKPSKVKIEPFKIID